MDLTNRITPEQLARFDQRIPRYTSYPPVPFWSKDFTGEDFAKHLEVTAEAKPNTPLSLYVHIPFCGKRCLFCACNVIITNKDHVADEYLKVLEKEIELVRSHASRTGKALQLHLGGGTPNYLNGDQMGFLINVLERNFGFEPDAERSIEVDPRVATPEVIDRLKNQDKFNRISFGVQDLNDETQAAIGREQTREITIRNVAQARESGFSSINIDLIYGLPRQSRKSWEKTLDDVLEMRPDRIALYNFAFLPERLAHQKQLTTEALPDREEKVDMFLAAHERLTTNGWRFIGMDHYALEEDSLTRALDDGSLRRNFMGYTTLRGTDMLAFGVSSISDYNGAFAQNVKKLTVHKRMVEEGILPVELGMQLSQDDLLRRQCIESIMCSGRLSRQDKRIDSVVREAQSDLEKLEREGLVELRDDEVVVTLIGRVFLRNIAVLFDAYLRNRKQGKPLFSRAV